MQLDSPQAHPVFILIGDELGITMHPLRNSSTCDQKHHHLGGNLFCSAFVQDFHCDFSASLARTRRAEVLMSFYASESTLNRHQKTTYRNLHFEKEQSNVERLLGRSRGVDMINACLRRPLWKQRFYHFHSISSASEANFERFNPVDRPSALKLCPGCIQRKLAHRSHVAPVWLS